MSTRVRMTALLALVGAVAVSSLVLRVSADPKPEMTWNVKIPGDDGAPASRLGDVLASARAAHRPVLIDFSAQWCAACRLLDRNTFADSAVIGEARRFVAVRVDAAREDAAVVEITRRFGVQGLPTIAFVSSSGQVLASPRIVGLVGPEAFAAELRKVR